MPVWNQKPPPGSMIDLMDPINTRCIGFWPFNDIGLKTITDISGFNGVGLNIGTSGPAFPNGAQVYFQALAGAGDNWVKVLDNSRYSFGNGTTDRPFSVAYRIYPTTLNAVANFVICKRGTIGAEWQISHTASSGPQLIVYSGGLTASYLGRFRAAALTTSTWYSVVATYDGSGVVGGIRVYINGQRADDTNLTVGTYVAMTDTAETLSFCNWGEPSSGFDVSYVGYLDYIRMWGRELTPGDALQLHRDRWAGVLSPQQMRFKSQVVASAKYRMFFSA